MDPHATAGAHAARLFASHQPWLLRRLRRYLGCAEDAQDVASDTFVQVILHPDPRAIAQPEAFLTTVAKRLVARLWRRRAIEQAYLERLQWQCEETAPSTEHQLMAVQALQEIDAWLSKLPIPARLAFLYRVMDDMSHEDIAARLGVSVRTVGRYLREAMLVCASMDDGAARGGS
ncbi:sigma-70 family RNA polymerase sigma factor [Achromobacter aloeverae]